MQVARILFLVPLVAGCYQYQPVTTASTPTGAPVRLTLTDAGSAQMAPALGPSVEEVGGKLLTDSADAYVVALSESRRRNGVEMDWRGEQVSISKSLVASIQLRQFSPTKTGFLTAGFIAALVVLERSFWGPGGVFGGGPPGPGPTPK
ncbi:MAG TPA: hypothetical protein VIH53_01090 [Gemmatimonadaceae bacterium]|jgi:hypothetical protein